jgi:hypothetical protein
MELHGGIKYILLATASLKEGINDILLGYVSLDVKIY